MGMPRFIGRSAELQQIKDLWKKACEGQPQVVNLIADTGVGKTRLVQAFYEWLSTDPEQGDGIGSQGYWPDDLGAGRQRVVNPPLERFAAFDLKNDRIPWLWWGIYWTDADGENECGVVRFHDFIDVHLSMLELQRNAYRKTLDTVSDAFKDEAINLVAGFIPGGSQVRSVFDLAKKLHANRKEQQEAQKGLASQDKSRRETLAESIFERLQATFNTKQNNVSCVPMVLFLDDIHFATDISRDGFSLQFLDRLLRQAAREQWPLLVLTTHWKGPWQAHCKGVNLEEGKPWRRIVMELDAKQNIKTPEIHTLKLYNIPREDLRSVVLDVLPGLNRDDQDKILGLVDNVRWLVEVLNALSDSVENFENNDRNRPLSDHGHRRLGKLLKTRGYLEVIRQRLEGDAMRDVRAVLGATAWHAHELEFVGPLACAFGEKLVEQGALPPSDREPGQQVLDVMMRALDPSALLEGQGQDNHLPNLVRFPERGYLEIAKELFDPVRLPALRLALGQEILAWMHKEGDQTPRWYQLDDVRHQRSFLEIAIEVLDQLKPQLSEEQREELATTEKILRRRLEKGKINEEGLQEELHEARQELLEEAEGPQLADAAQWEAVAMMELVNILKDQGNGRALILAFELAEHQHLASAIEYIKSGTLINLIDLWQENATYLPKARFWLDTLIKIQTAFLEFRETPQSLGDLTVTLPRLAKLDKAAGDIDQARAGYQRCLEIWMRLLDKFGVTAENLRGVTISMESIADMDKEAGASYEARVGYQQCLKFSEHLLAELGESPERLRDLTISLERLAALDLEIGDVDRARAGYQRSLEIGKRILADFGETPEDLRNLTIPLERLAKLDEAAGGSDQARAVYWQCLDIRERLLTEFGDTPERLHDLGFSLLCLAHLDKAIGASNRAREGYQRCLNIWERLLVVFGETAERLLQLSVPLVCLAELDQAAGDIDQALANNQRSLEIGEHLLDKFGVTRRHLENLNLHLLRLAILDEAVGSNDRARARYQRSLEIGEHLLAEFGATHELLWGLTIPLMGVADLDEEAGENDRARAGYQRCLEIRERLIAEFGVTHQRLWDLTIPLIGLADLDEEAGENDRARAGYQRCLEIRERLIAEFGETSEWLQGLTVPLERMADMDEATGAPDEARGYYQRSLEIGEHLIAEFGVTHERLWDLSIPLMGLADLDAKAGEPDRARAGYQRCLKIEECLLAELGENPERLRNLNFVLERLENLNRATSRP
ncbi:AAA family ATPase [Halomonas sp.]|uniref:AAA family ATPase n=1 Tax=Halomonas sp. TaxID=1486246 RepID=UPI00384FE26C